MSENEQTDERVEISVTVLGEKLQLILPGDGWTFDEAKVAKNVSEGMSPKQIEAGLLEGDPDAWLAVLRVSYIRANKEFPSRQIQGEDVIALFNRLLEVSEEAIRSRPPTNRNGSEAEEPSGSETPDPEVHASA